MSDKRKNMMIEGFGKTLHRPHLRILSPDQCRVIHGAAMEILEHTGVCVGDPQVLAMLRDHGCRVREGSNVSIPERLVAEAVGSAPKRITIFNRNGERAMHLEGRNAYFGSQVGCPYILDHETGQRRQFELQDAANTAMLTDGLTNIDFMVISGFASDLPVEQADLACFEAVMANTSKPIVSTATNLASTHAILDSARTAVGGEEQLRREPSILHYCEPLSPLQHTQEGLAKLIACVDAGIPVVYTPLLMLGATAPATEAGLLAICVAEELSGLVISQLRRPGTPIIFGGIATVMDMATQVCSYGAPELNRMCAALTDMAHHYDLPMYGTAGCTDSKVCDGQAIAELVLSCTSAFLSGANLIHDLGIIESANAVSLDIIAMADEIISIIRSSWQHIEINEETLALDLIRHIGPCGNFISEDHTFNHFREVYHSPMIDRRQHQPWHDTGSSTFQDRINGRIKAIIHEHKQEQPKEEIAV